MWSFAHGYYYYNVGDGEAQFIQVYFLEKECVRIRISSNETFAHTSRGIYSGNTYSQMEMYALSDFLIMLFVMVSEAVT